MKKQNYLLLLASSMLLAMNLASCKMSNKPAPEAGVYDKGRPFILAGHSQGSSILIYPFSILSVITAKTMASSTTT